MMTTPKQTKTVFSKTLYFSLEKRLFVFCDSGDEKWGFSNHRTEEKIAKQTNNFSECFGLTNSNLDVKSKRIRLLGEIKCHSK